MDQLVLLIATFMVSELAEDMGRLRRSLGNLPPPQVEPPLVVVSGLPGAGKSFLCRRLAQRAPFAILASDTLRKVLFPCPQYDEDENKRLFGACHALIEELLENGIPIIFDATNLLERHREHLYHAAEKARAKLILVSVEAPEGVVRQRLLAREKGLDPEYDSEADWEVYQKMRPRREKIFRSHFVVDTSRDIADAVDKVVRAVKR